MSPASSDLIRSSVRALHAYTPGEQTADPSVLKLNTNENPYGPCPGVGEVLRSMAADQLRLYPDPVCGGLRRALGELHGCMPKRILVGNGSDEVLALCLRAFVARPGVVGYFDPSYSLYPVLAAIEDLESYPVGLTEDFGWAPPDPARSDLFFITNPNAPTSLRFPRDRIEAFCDQASGVVVIDEAYADFARESCLDLALTRSNVLVTRSFSKSYGLAGMRLGYAVGPEPLIEALYKIKDSYNVNALTQAVGEAAVRDQKALRQTLRRVIQTRDRVAAELRARRFRVFDSQTNFLWIEPPMRPAEEWFRRLREQGILVRFFPGARTDRYLRVTIGKDDGMDRFLEGVDRLLPDAG